MPVSKLDKGAARARARAVSPKTVADRILARMAEPDALAGGELFAGLVHGKTGATYGYNGRFWEPAEPATLEHIAWRGDIAETGTTKKSRIGDIITMMRASVYKHDLEFMRCADHEIPVRNGVVDVLTGRIRPHRREDWLDGVLPVDFDPRARADVFEAAMAQWFGAEACGAFSAPDDRADALVDFFGYIALPHAKFKRALVLYGESDTGKSVPVKLARKLVGEEFCCALGVHQMDDPVIASVIKHKRLNTLTELTSDALIADGGFKTMVSTEEAIGLNPKYEKPHQYTPIAKHVIATNKLPTINDRTSATYNRLLIIPFTRVFESKEQDEGLFARMTTPAQLSGLLNLAIAGAARLIARRGQFVAPKAGDAINLAMREEANPINAYIDARLIKGDSHECLTAGQLADDYNAWNKGGKKVDRRTIGKLLRETKKVEWSKFWNRAEGGNDVGLMGWRLRSANDVDNGRPPETPPPDDPPPYDPNDALLD
jgi:P4 family phage/plasmid primase-like protien